jgi:hypothetical protein
MKDSRARRECRFSRERYRRSSYREPASLGVATRKGLHPDVSLLPNTPETSLVPNFPLTLLSSDDLPLIYPSGIL